MKACNVMSHVRKMIVHRPRASLISHRMCIHVSVLQILLKNMSEAW